MSGMFFFFWGGGGVLSSGSDLMQFIRKLEQRYKIFLFYLFVCLE